jgi:hypothetical protein
MSEVSNAEKLRCVERELKMRRSVYPRWTAAGKMSAPQADHEIKVMSAVVDDYRAAVEKERLI